MATVNDNEKDAYRVNSVSVEWQGPEVGDKTFVVAQGGNGSLPTYQQADGAPIEVESPLGYNVQFFTIIFLNVGQMIGTGVFSTRKSKNYYTNTH